MDGMTTSRLALPLIAAGQAGKELSHNEALARLDLAVGASVVAVGIDTPPADPVPGAAWIVGATPTGAWAGQAGAIAGWTGGGWRFLAPAAGMSVWVESLDLAAQFVAGSWTVGIVRAARLTIDGEPSVQSRAAAIADPNGGSVIDGEARTSIAAILATLRHHGLIG